MQVQELDGLAKWIKDNIETAQIPQKYAILVNKVLLNTRSNQKQIPFKDEKNTLIAALTEMPMNALSHSQLKILEKIGILNAIGETGAKTVMNIFTQSGIDMASAYKDLIALNKKVTESQSWAKSITAALLKVIESEDIDLSAKGEIVFRVRFTREASINNIVDLKNWSDAWHDIIRGIALTQRLAPEEVRVIGATNGSIIAVLGIGRLLAKVVTSIIKDVLSLVSDGVELASDIENLKQKKYDTKTALIELEKVQAKHKEERAAQLVDRIMGSENVSSIDGESRNALEKSINKLLDFYEKGGDVDIVVPEETTEDVEETDEELAIIKDIRSNVIGIREYEEKIGLLEHIIGLDPEDDS